MVNKDYRILKFGFSNIQHTQIIIEVKVHGKVFKGFLDIDKDYNKYYKYVKVNDRK